MRYLEIDIGPWTEEPSPWWGRILQKVIPAANPDFEKIYPKTRKWWVEIDDEGKPLREIGFDAEHNPIVLGPIGRNYGFLVDSPINWKESEGDSDEAGKNFETTWQELLRKFYYLEK